MNNIKFVSLKHYEIEAIYQSITSELNNQTPPYLVLAISLPNESSLVSVLMIGSAANSCEGHGITQLHPDEIEGVCF